MLGEGELAVQGGRSRQRGVEDKDVYSSQMERGHKCLNSAVETDSWSPSEEMSPRELLTMCQAWLGVGEQGKQIMGFSS